MSKEIWCTLGPSSLNDRVIGRLEDLGVSLFRLNLSHTRLDRVAEILEYIQSRTMVPVCLDTEGAQVRTTELAAGKAMLREGALVRVHYRRIPCDASDLNLHPDCVATQLRIGDLLKIDAEVLAQVVGIEDQWVLLSLLHGGEIGQNKAVTLLGRDIELPALTEKDCQALAIGRTMGVRYVALSFANRAADVQAVRDLAGPHAHVTSKIECLGGLRNLAEIAADSNALLIDRGDMSRQVNIERLPALQKAIIRHAKLVGKKIYIATNLLESMVTSAVPTRAEVNDVFNTLADGADGLVLAAETAIGAFPVAAAMMVRKVIREYENEQRWQHTPYVTTPLSTLAEPHGGALINREAVPAAPRALNHLRTLQVSDTALMDCVQIADGTYSPLTGFLGSQELASVLRTNRLLNGQAWTMPILLQAEQTALEHITPGDQIQLTDSQGQVHAILKVAEIYPVDLEELAEKWFGTASRQHPGVARLVSGGDRCLAGEVTLVERIASPYRHLELSPNQTRMIFTHKGWSRVAGFQTGHVADRFQEYAQLRAVESGQVDGIYVSLVIGPQQSGDFLPDPIVKSYQLLLGEGVYPAGKVVLGGSFIYPRYCGPREAVFLALCHKNMGCSHFIVQSNHGEANGCHGGDQTRRLFDALGDIGITPLFFDPIVYNPETHTYFESKSAQPSALSHAVIQFSLVNNAPLPDWMLRDVVQEMLHDELTANRAVFH
jgi:pyruvate kinase